MRTREDRKTILLAVAMAVVVAVYMGWFFNARSECLNRGGHWVQGWPMYECINEDQP